MFYQADFFCAFHAALNKPNPPEPVRDVVASAVSEPHNILAALGAEIIHSVTNPLDQFSAAIHVYGGDFFTQPRSECDPETLIEHPYGIEYTRQVFRDANAQFRNNQ